MLKKLTNELSLINVGFSYSQANYFVESQWQHGPRCLLYVIYRWFIAIFFIIAITVALYNNQNEREWLVWPIYLTRWGLVLNVVANCLGAILVTLHNYSVSFHEKIFAAKKLPTSIKIYWALHSIIVTLAILITFVYWAKLHKYGNPILITDYFNHIGNSVVLIVDMMVIKVPYRLYHLIYSVLVGAIFLIFSIIYYFAGGLNQEYQHSIYPILDWTNVPETLLNSVIVLAMLVVIHSFVYCIYCIRIWIYKSRQKKCDNNTMMLTVVAN